MIKLTLKKVEGHAEHPLTGFKFGFEYGWPYAVSHLGEVMDSFKRYVEVSKGQYPR